MSIPPLVCSTPPPPDQCDDKDIEEFDIPYNLSQEEDDSQDYDYQNFTSFNHFQAASQEKKLKSLPASKHTEINNLPKSPGPEQDKVIVTKNIHSSSQVKNPENGHELIEDLDLGIETQNKENLSTNDIPLNSDVNMQCENNSNILFHESSITQGHTNTILTEETFSNELSETTATPNMFLNEINSLMETIPNEIDIKETSDSPQKDITSNTDEVDQNTMLDNITNLVDEYSLNNDKNKHIDETKTFQFTNEMISSVSNEQCSENNSCNVIETEISEKAEKLSVGDDDDFGDFEDFKVSSPENKSTPILSDTANPWENQPCDSDFGKFEANFDQFTLVADNIVTASSYQSNVVEVDDFGDFDDFQTAPVRQQSTEDIETKQLTEEEIEDLIKNTFGNEDTPTDGNYEGKIESHLSETWRHLKDIDIRQPYMINWNNTSGQNTLLKALCIDSRNILFAPKWGQANNMPKFAANLSAAPLQPQKSLSTSTTASELSSSSKPADTWVDPTTSQNQEFTYAEALLLDLEHLMATLDQLANNNSSLKISDLLSHACNDDVASVAAAEPMSFNPPASTISDSMFKRAPTVPPLRQINLPDTHIYTPTDSEIPRSTTIHYNNGSPAVLPQTVINNKIDDDYNEFQDFKSATSVVSKENVTLPNTTIGQVKSEVKFDSQILQPIKVEPVLPTLDWPEPGQVKNSFDDFSDYVSNVNWTNSVPSTSSSKEPQIPTSLENPEIKPKPVIDTVANNLCNDDFEAFQSVNLPQQNAFKNVLGVSPGLNSITSLDKRPSLEISKPIGTFDVDFSALESLSSKSNSNISTSILSTDTKHCDFSSLPSTTLPTMRPQHIETNSILQPTPLNNSTAQVKQTSGQILQPLSLESYSQINWPNPGLDIQDWSRFNPVDTIQTLKTDLNAGGSSSGSPAHSHKGQTVDDDWGEFVSSRPVQKPQNKQPPRQVLDDDEWTDFVSSPSVKPPNGLNTISFNVHSNLKLQKTANKVPQAPLDIPSLNYITPKTNTQKAYTDSHFQNL